jgi:trimeric autotransporter adhesin
MISGTNLQTVDCGENRCQVTAVPDEDYEFVDRSDGATDNPRTDTNVMADITVTAHFRSAI